MSAAFIVEGSMEQRIVQKICGRRAVVRTLGCNGQNTPLDRIVDRSMTMYRLLQNKNWPIFFIFDREMRIESSEQIESIFIELMISASADKSQFSVVVPDRMTENWIIAGHHKFSEAVNSQGREVDGCHGKATLIHLMSSIGNVYKETSDGVDLFARIDVESARETSASFRRFYNAVSDYCPWARNKG